MRGLVFVFAFLILLASFSPAQQLWVINTYAGGGPNHAALAGSVGYVSGVSTDPSGNVYISSGGYFNAVLEVSSGNVFRVAGANTSQGIYLGDGIPATLAVLPSVLNAGVDASGQIFIPDFVTNHIYKIDTSGIITTIAGNGAVLSGTKHNCGFDGDGPALQHSLCVPYQIVPDGKGNVLFSDTGNCLVRKIDSQGNLTTVAGTGPTIYGTCPPFDGDGPATSHAVSPAGIAIDASGDLYIADEPNQLVRKVDASGNMATVAGNGTASFSGDGGPAISASLNNPNGLAVDAAGNLYIMDTMNLRVRKVDTSGKISTAAGNGTGNCSASESGPALQQGVCGEWVAVDPAGNLYFDQTNYYVIYKIDTGGNLAVFAGNGAHYDVPNGMPALQASLLNTVAVATDPSGTVYFTEVGDELAVQDGVTKIASDGTTSRITNGGLSAVDGMGDVYWAVGGLNEVVEYLAGGSQAVIAGTGQSGICLYNGDGAATTHNLCNPSGVALDSLGNVYIADTDNCRVRKIDTSGNMTTIAGYSNCTFDGDGPPTAHALNLPSSVAVDAAGNVYVADTGNNRVREISADGSAMTTIAGIGLLLDGQCVFDGDGPATQHSLCSPNGVAVDSAGDVFVLDPGNVRIRMVSGGNMTTLAGNGQSSFAGENAPASTATLDHPMAIAADASGNVYVADEYNNRIRKISQTASFVVAAGQPTLTLTAGTSGTVTLQVTAANGFSGTVSFSCSGAPQGASCTPLPTSENVSGGSASTTFTVTTTAESTAAASVFALPPAPGPTCWAFALTLMALATWRSKRRCLALGLTVAVLALVPACGGTGSSGGGGGGGTPTPKGSYVLTLSATSGTTTQSTTVKLNVQ
jgi:sugar lactone lactonase YvrE